MWICEEFEIVVDTTIVIPSSILVSASDEPSMDIDVCEKSKIDVDTSVSRTSIRCRLALERMLFLLKP